jgi:hypothetical protein
MAGKGYPDHPVCILISGIIFSAIASYYIAEGNTGFKIGFGIVLGILGLMLVTFIIGAIRAECFSNDAKKVLQDGGGNEVEFLPHIW